MTTIDQERKRDKLKERKTKWGKETERTKERRFGCDVCERESSGASGAPTNYSFKTQTRVHTLIHYWIMTFHRWLGCTELNGKRKSQNLNLWTGQLAWAHTRHTSVFFHVKDEDVFPSSPKSSERFMVPTLLEHLHIDQESPTKAKHHTHTYQHHYPIWLSRVQDIPKSLRFLGKHLCLLLCLEKGKRKVMDHWMLDITSDSKSVALVSASRLTSEREKYWRSRGDIKDTVYTYLKYYNQWALISPSPSLSMSLSCAHTHSHSYYTNALILSLSIPGPLSLSFNISLVRRFI